MAKDLMAKATASVIEDPQGQGLVLEDTSLPNGKETPQCRQSSSS